MRTVDPRLLVLAAVALQSGVQGLMSGRVSAQESLLFNVIGFGLCTLVYLGVLRLRGGARRLSPAERRLMLGLNALSAITFIGYYVSLTLVPASTTSALTTAISPAVVGVTMLVTGRARLTATKWAFAGALCVVAGVLAVWSWDSGGAESAAGGVAGVALAVCAGWGMATITVLSRRFGELGVSPLLVTAHRFHLTYGLAAVLWLATGAYLPSGGQLLSLTGYSVAAAVLPLFLLQVGVQRADPLASMMIIITGPSMVYLVQVVTGAPFDTVTLALILTVIALSVLYRTHGERLPRPTVSPPRPARR
jgi:drug/metabolite transporter (DMT)-like permease